MNLSPEVGLGHGDDLAIDDEDAAPVRDLAVLEVIVADDGEAGADGALDVGVALLPGHDVVAEICLAVLEAGGDVGRSSVIPPVEIEVIPLQGILVEVARRRPHIVAALEFDGLIRLPRRLGKEQRVVQELRLFPEGEGGVDREGQDIGLLQLDLGRFLGGASAQEQQGKD